MIVEHSPKILAREEKATTRNKKSSSPYKNRQMQISRGFLVVWYGIASLLVYA